MLVAQSAKVSGRLQAALANFLHKGEYIVSGDSQIGQNPFLVRLLAKAAALPGRGPVLAKMLQQAADNDPRKGPALVKMLQPAEQAQPQVQDTQSPQQQQVFTQVHKNYSAPGGGFQANSGFQMGRQKPLAQRGMMNNMLNPMDVSVANLWHS
jgi:hypothetical protein